jgi:glucose-6-phosphate 1-dehydrogenase
MMVDETTGYWNRMIIEKPFGRDSESSEKLATELTSLFAEHQLYRIDHYLGKDMVQNILSVRLSNIFFSSVWNKEHVESVSISWAEDIGTQGRYAFFFLKKLIFGVNVRLRIPLYFINYLLNETLISLPSIE